MSEFTKELPTVPIVPVWWFFIFFFLWVYTNTKNSSYWREHHCSLASYDPADKDWVPWVWSLPWDSFSVACHVMAKSNAPKETSVQEQRDRLHVGLLSVILWLYLSLTIRGSTFSHLRERACGLGPGRGFHRACKGTSPAAFGCTGRDAVMSSCAWVSLEEGKCVQLCPAQPTPWCSSAKQYVGNSCPFFPHQPAYELSHFRIARKNKEYLGLCFSCLWVLLWGFKVYDHGYFRGAAIDLSWKWH